MKKIILFAVILFAGVSLSSAQAPVVTEGKQDFGTTKLNVILTPFQTITVNTAQNEVNLEYSSAELYKTGVTSSEQVEHLLIESTGAFDVTVKAEDLKSTIDHSKTMSASTIMIKSISNTAKELKGATTRTVRLANNDVKLISSSKGGTNKAFDITYTAAKDDKYTENYMLNNQKTTYTTDIYYTITAR